MPSMSVTEAMKERCSVRRFTSQQVDQSLLQEIIALAGHAPSNSNLQPWKVIVAQGEKLSQVLSSFNQGLYTDGEIEEPQYAIYPGKLSDVHKARRNACAELMYEALEIPREDKAARIQHVMKNFSFFGAPAGMIISMKEEMGLGQAIDVGAFMQSIMLLAAERGLATCPQASWAQWPKRVKSNFGIADDEQVMVGMAIGYADPDEAVNLSRQPRIPQREFATFLS